MALEFELLPKRSSPAMHCDGVCTSSLMLGAVGKTSFYLGRGSPQL